VGAASVTEAGKRDLTKNTKSTAGRQENPMTIDEYAEWTATVSKPIFESRDQRLAYMLLGLIGEVGEMADTARRATRDGTPLNEDKFVYELGDVLHHWVSLCMEFGQLPSAMLLKSQSNITARALKLASD
jgi:MazG nucleotide pyrophosphohydrolase domain